MEPPHRNDKERLRSRWRPVTAAPLASLCLVLAACGSTGTGDTDPSTTIGSTTTSVPVTDETPGITEDGVVFGQSAALSGPAAELGLEMRLGIMAAFSEVNAAGGINGRQLDLISLDDSYEPEMAIANTNRLIEQERVFALIGEVGTPTSRSVTPVAADAEIPFVAPFTGAAFLRSESWSNVVNLRASYAQETEEMVERITVDLGIDRIAVMYQDDSFGRTGLQGALAALQRRGLEPVALGTYPRNTTAIKSGLFDITLGNPDAVIIVGAYRPVAATISWARHIGFDPTFVTISFVGSNALAEELGSAGEGVYVTQVVPFPTDRSIPIVASYLAALTAYAPDASPSFISLEGYLSGRLAIAGLESCRPDPTRQCFLDALLASNSMTIDEFPLTFGPGDNQGSDRVYLTAINQDGEYIPVDLMERR